MTGSSRATDHRILFGSFPALEPRLFHAIADLQKDDPLRPVTIVVTSNLLGVHLRRRYVEWRETRGFSPAHAGLTFSTLEAFAAQVAGPGDAPLPPFGEFALISSAIARVPESRVFGDLAGRPEIVPSIEATLRDLADAGVAPKAFRAFVRKGALSAERRLLLGALARLYEELDRGASGYETRAKTFRRAAASRGAAAEPLLLYGFYDATGVQKDFLAAAARRGPVAAFVPRPPGRCGEYAEPFLRWAEERLPASREAAPSPSGPLADFARRLGEDFEAPAPRDSVRLVSAAGAAAERVEIAREVLEAAAAGVPLHRIGVIVRESGPWSAALSRALARFGVPNFEYRAENAAGSPAGRAVRLWWDLEAGGFSREDVLGVLELLGSGEGFRSPRSLARRAGIIGGPDEWTARLERLADDSADERERRAARSLGERSGRVVSSARDWPIAAAPWREWARVITRRLETLFAPNSVPSPVAAAAEAVDALEELGGAVERASAANVFFAALEEQREIAGRLGVDGVFIGSATAARGLTFERTIVARLVEREFPLPGRPDPLLFDGERLALARETGRPVPLKAEPRASEERQLFGIAVESALSGVVLTASRRDEGLTRECLPSPFFAAACRAASGTPDAALRSTDLGVPVAEGPSVDAGEAYDRALARHGPATVAAAFPSLARARSREDLRHAPRWTAFEGRLSDAARAALARHRIGAGDPLSASRVARFGLCPYAYFLRNVVGLAPWEEADRAAELGPLALGIAFHDAARRIVAATSASGWPPSPAESAGLAARFANEALAGVEESRGPLAPALVREIARERVETLVRAWLDFERRRGDGGRPAGAEVPLAPDGAPFVVQAGGSSVPFTGSIDRVDVDADGRPFRVVDYKVKLAEGFRKAFGADARIIGGEAVQLPLYALASGGPIASEYLVLEAGDAGAPAVYAVPFSAEATGEAIALFRDFLAGMDAAIADGIFAPRTSGRLQKEPCRFCDFAEVCGPGHEARFAAKDADPSPAARALRALRDLP